MIEQLATDTFETKSGLTIRVRPILPDDAPYLVDLFENMSSESRYNRFLQPLDQIDIDRVWNEAEQIAHQSTAPSHGLVAFADLPEREDVPVGAARYVELTAGKAEIAVSVRDDMQNIGIGTELVRRLASDAAQRGVDQFIGTVQNGNVPVWSILGKLGRRVERRSEGSYSTIVVHLNDSSSRVEDWLDAAADFSPEPQIIW